MLAEINPNFPFPWVEVGGNLMIIIIVVFALLIRVIIAHMRHKEIMAAIAKGIPVSELRPMRMGMRNKNWIGSISFGILIMPLGLYLIAIAVPLMRQWQPESFLQGPSGTLPILMSFGGVLFLGLGIANIVQGILLKKCENNKKPNGPNISQ
jgi:hypothetical protein